MDWHPFSPELRINEQINFDRQSKTLCIHLVTAHRLASDQRLLLYLFRYTADNRYNVLKFSFSWFFFMESMCRHVKIGVCTYSNYLAEWENTYKHAHKLLHISNWLWNADVDQSYYTPQKNSGNLALLSAKRWRDKTVAFVPISLVMPMDGFKRYN